MLIITVDFERIHGNHVISLLLLLLFYLKKKNNNSRDFFTDLKVRISKTEWKFYYF